MRYRIAICDDDSEYAKQIECYIKHFCAKQKREISIKIYTDSKELMNTVKDHIIYDLYILDIEMPEYSGMDFLAELKYSRVESDAILLTSHVGYAVEAHDYSQVFRYIPKENFTQRLDAALCDFFIKMERKLGCQPYTIETKLKAVRMFQEEIAFVFKDRKYAVFVMGTGQNERERCGLQEVYKKLNNSDMIMLDRSFIVNIRHVRRIQQDKVTLDVGEPIYTSREHIVELKNAFNRYWGNLI